MEGNQMNLLTLLLSCVPVSTDSPTPPKEESPVIPPSSKDDPDCFRSIQTNECTEVPHETDAGILNCTEEATYEEFPDCFVMEDGVMVNFIKLEKGMQ
jgi:hypothetical protein